MNTKTLLGGAFAVAALAAAPGLANAQATQAGTPAIAAAGSPIVVPGDYFGGTVTSWDPVARTIGIDGVTYPVGTISRVDRDITIGNVVDVTYVVEHYGRAARKVVMRARLAGRPEDAAP